jgi:hypothetical protein
MIAKILVGKLYGNKGNVMDNFKLNEARCH